MHGLFEKRPGEIHMIATFFFVCVCVCSEGLAGIRRSFLHHSTHRKHKACSCLQRFPVVVLLVRTLPPISRKKQMATGSSWARFEGLLCMSFVSRSL